MGNTNPYNNHNDKRYSNEDYNNSEQRALKKPHNWQENQQWAQPTTVPTNSKYINSQQWTLKNPPKWQFQPLEMVNINSNNKPQ